MNERQIFEAALEITDPARREAFLSQACVADAALRQRVDALLAAHAAASQFLETPAVQQLRSLDPQVRSNLPTPDSRGEDTMQLPPGHAPAANEDDSDTPSGPDLSFLSPSTKPGSIGTLGHYEILNVLGQGAFGIVFRAFDEKLHRYVAIKTMSVQMAATSPPRKRFLREARAAAAIRHENVVQVYSVEEQPLPYLVMEFIDGETLQQKQRDHGPLELPELLHIGRQIAAGLAAAHAQSLIHRDVKPGNILIEKGAEQKVKITDFGLARAADDASLTRSGMISGTPLYMAPEQALGQTLDHRSDLFSLGSVLYELATGRPPFRAPNTVAVLRRVVDDTPRPIQEIIPETPDWLVAIINKLLEKQPDDRYQTAKEVADLLARCHSELQHNGQVTCVPGAGSVSARSTPHRLPKSSETSEVSPRANAPKLSRPPLATKTNFLLGWLAILACLPILWYALTPGSKPSTIDRSGSRKNSAEPSADGESLTTSATEPTASGVASAPRVPGPSPDSEGSRPPLTGPAIPMPAVPVSAQANWTNLFDGTTTTGWKTLGPFQVGDGLLKASEHGVAVTEKSYDNFELELEWRVVAGGNSGVYYRANPEKLGTSYTFPGTEFQLLDNAQHPDGQNPKTSAGALYGVIPPEGTFTKPAGEWNTSRIVARGPQVEHWVNDQKVLAYDMDSDAWRQALTTAKNAVIATNAASRAGVIALQGHTGEIAFRQIRIHEIPAMAPKATASKFPPLAPGWFERVSQLPPEEQVKEVSLELKRRNPEWDGKLEHIVDGDHISSVSLDSSHVADITPLSVFTRLYGLTCAGRNHSGQITDLSPLANLKSLVSLSLTFNQITDLTPLRDVPIPYLDLTGNPITDLAPLAGKPIVSLSLAGCANLVELSPIKGAPLSGLLIIAGSGIRDVTPLRDSKVENAGLVDYQFDPDIVCGWPLKAISFQDTIQKVPREKLLRLKEIKTLETIDGKPVAEFWKEFDQAADKP